MTPDQRLLAQLRSYYDANGIGATHFRCRHAASCRSLSSHFTTAQETFVGPHYADGTHPRLLFLSLDSPTLEADAHERTFEGVRARTLKWELFQQGQQWRQTNEMAHRLMHHFLHGLAVGNAVRYFAHANSAKCSVHNPGRRQAPALLFQNCREFIPGEIRILRPDIFVTQGAAAKRIAQTFPTVKDVGQENGCSECEAQIIRLDAERSAIWLHCHHSSAYGLFWKQKAQCWPHYERAVIEFLGGGTATALGEQTPPPLPPRPPVAAQPDPEDRRGVFVWVNSCDRGWVIHGRARSSEARAREVADVLRREWGWETAAGGTAPAGKPPRRDAPPAEVAMRSPASPSWRR